MGRFENRIALVTGAAQGIGFAITELLASEGAKVYGADINLEVMSRERQHTQGEGPWCRAAPAQRGRPRLLRGGRPIRGRQGRPASNSS